MNKYKSLIPYLVCFICGIGAVLMGYNLGFKEGARQEKEKRQLYRYLLLRGLKDGLKKERRNEVRGDPPR